MYIDPNVGGMLFQALAVVFTAVTGLVFVFSRRIRSGVARLRRRFRNSKGEASSIENEDAED